MVPVGTGSLGVIKKRLEENICKIAGNINPQKQPCRKYSVNQVMRDKLAP